MDRFLRRAQQIWDESPVVAWALVISGIGLVLWATFRPQSPGVSIGLLALVAGIMSVRPQMHTAEKLTWVGVLILLAILEVAAIGRSDRENKAERDTQNAKFEEIARGLKDSIQQSKDQFSQDELHFEDVLGKAAKGNELVQESIADITGGKSFGFVVPQPGGVDSFALRVWNEGDHPLLGVTITISDTTNDPNWEVGLYKPIYIGNIGPHDSLPVPDLALSPRVESKSGQQSYWIFVSAQNGTVSQSLYFRHRKDGKPGWAYSYLVTKPTSMMKIINGTQTRITEMQPRMHRHWSDEVSQPH
jgi:hypothetical protein